MKRGAKLAVLAVSLAVLVGAWYLAATLSQRQQQEHAAEAELLDISVGDGEDVTAVAWDYFGDAVSLTKSSGKWKNANDDTCPIDSAAVSALVEAVSSAQATDKIEEVTDFAQYGLADCPFTIVAGAGDDIVTYEIGNTAVTGGQYVRLNGEDTVYVETGVLGPAFQISLDDVLALESVPDDIDMLTGLAADTEGGVYELRYLDDAGEQWYSSADPWFMMDADGKPLQPLDTDAVEQLCRIVTELRLDNCQDWNMTDPAKYGLDMPQGTVLVGYMSMEGRPESFALEFGDYVAGDVYVRFAGSNMVYLVSGTVLDALMYPDFAGMATLDPCALDWEKLQSVLLETEDGASYEIVRSVVDSAAGDGEQEDVYTLGARSLDATAVGDWLRQLYELPAESRAAADVEGRGLLFRLTFRQESELYPVVTAEFQAYDSVHVLCLVNGTDRYLISRTVAEDVPAQAMEFLIELPVSPSPEPPA